MRGKRPAAGATQLSLCCQDPAAICGRNPAPQIEAELIDYYWAPESGLDLRPESGLDLRPESGARKTISFDLSPLGRRTYTAWQRLNYAAIAAPPDALAAEGEEEAADDIGGARWSGPAPSGRRPRAFPAGSGSRCGRG